MTNLDIELTKKALAICLEEGARKARVTFNCSTEDLISTLNGKVDRISCCEDRSLTLALFANGKYGSFSTNRLEENELREFIRHALRVTLALQEDIFRDLPSPERYCRNATDGNELKLLDSSYFALSPEDKKRIALQACIYGSDDRIISEEGEYSDSIFETLVVDSQGLFCRHSETNFDYGVEITVGDGEEKYSGYWWDSSCRSGVIDGSACGRKALQKALAQIGAGSVAGLRTTMVVESDVASKMVSPVLEALNAYSLQQNNSFLQDSLGKTVFSSGMNVVDDPWLEGQSDSKLFDSEGVATKPGAIIENGSVKKYFVNSYMAAKSGFEPTNEEACRPHLLPFPRKGLSRDEIIARCGQGILVTGFNGGNSNSTTGDFSYGIEGFEFRGGKITKPVSGMLVTGNFITLWNNLLYAGDDFRVCMSKLIPTLAFGNVDFNGE